MHKEIFSQITTQLAQTVMILTAQATEEYDTMRMIMEEEEYRSNGSYEQIAQIVEQYSMIAKLDILNFWEQLTFGWVVGCSQMGYDSFALHSPHKGLYALSPAFDLNVEFSEDELQLTLNKKRREITHADFEVAMKSSGLRAKIINGIFSRFAEALPKWHEIVNNSTLPDEVKVQYNDLLTSRILRLTPKDKA